jgi:hypothetical protein
VAVLPSVPQYTTATALGQGMVAALIAHHVRGEHVPLEMLVDLRFLQLLWS